MDDVFYVHDVARIRNGRHAGQVGTVTESRWENGKQTMVRVNFDGVKNGEPVTGHVWLKRSQVERNHGA